MLYLYVKQHTKTKLKYFGKTTRDPYKYKGSGVYWKKHIRKYGIQHVETIEVWSFNDQEECTQFALAFSKTNDIVQSDIWANFIIEDGLGGRGIPGHTQSAETKNKRSIKMKGISKSESHKQNMRKPKSNTDNMKKTDATRLKMSKPKSEEHRKNISLCQLGKKHSDETRKKMCGKYWITNGSITKRVYPHEMCMFPDFYIGRHWKNSVKKEQMGKSAGL
jgi:hypothetical protein